MNYFTQAVEVILITGVGVVVYHLLARIVRQFTKNDYIPTPLEPLIIGLCKWLLIIIGILLIFQVFGIPASHILTALSTMLVLVAIGFVALWSTLSNILCAFLLLMFPPFRFGDEIEIKDPEKEKGVRGIVKNLNLFYTTLVDTLDTNTNGILIRIPNTMFFQRIIVCYEKKDTQELKLGSAKQDKGMNASS